MASGARRIVVEFLGKDTSLSRTADTAERKTSHMGERLRKVGKIAATGLAAGAIVGAAALVKMTKGAAEDEAAQKRLAVTLRNTAGATKEGVAGVEAWISKVGLATGVTDDELRPALAKLVAATHDVGKAQKLASLAMNVSAGTGKSLETVSTALAKAQNGSVAGLAKLGIKVKDSTKDAVGFKHAQTGLKTAQLNYTKAVKDHGATSAEAKIAADKVTEAQMKLGEMQGKVKQTTITSDEAMKRLADTYKGQAASQANTLEGKMSRLKLVMAETGETIGAKLIPVVTRLATWFLEKAVPAIQGFFDKMKSGEGAAGGFRNILQGVGDVVKAVAGFIGHELVPFVKELAGRFADAMGGTDGMKKSMKSLEPTVRVVKAVLGVLWDGLKIAARVIVPLIAAQLRVMIKVIGAVGRIATWLWNNAFQPALKMIVKGFGWVMDGIAKFLRALSHIPGFKWAKTAADKMEDAARKARGLADAINKIPKNKKVSVTTTFTERRRRQGVPGTGGAMGRLANGTSDWRGGLTTINERGDEIVDLPKHTRVIPHSLSKQIVAKRANAAGPAAAAPITINFNGLVTDPKAVAREVRKVLLDLKRSNGGAPLGIA